MNEHEPQLRLRQAQPYLIKGPGEEGDYTKWETELAHLTTA